MEWYEAAFDRFYPVLYSHRDREEASGAVETFGHFFDGRSPVLDLASGDGRYLEALTETGREAFGLDLSHFLLRRSVEELGQGGRVVQGDMRHLPFVSASFGGVINMFTSFGYFSRDTDNLLVFKELCRVLKPGGVFLFDFINAARISTSLLGETNRESMGFHIHERRRIEDHGKYLRKQVILTDRETRRREAIEERLRLYTRNDLVVMFESVGLGVLKTFGDYQGNEFVEGVSERVIMVTRKAG